MKYYFFLLFFIGFLGFGQIVKKSIPKNTDNQDSLVVDSGSKDSLKIFKPTIQDYQYFTQFSERKVIDTVLSHDKTFIFSQWNNQDNFGRQQFANIGSGFNPLVYETNTEQNLALLPTNKSFGILGVQDVKYYDVKTPTTTFIYHTAMRNGAALNSTYTQNIGKNFNFALEYMGLRSQGFYSNSLAANNNTLFSAHYISKNSKYEAFAHFIHQNVSNQENGGIANDELFLSDADAYNNRANVEVNLIGSNSKFSYRRFYFSHQFTPFNSEKYPFRIRHTIFSQSNKYYYSDSSLQSFYYDNATEIVSNYPTATGKFSKNLSNTLSLIFDNSRFNLEAGLRHQLLKIGVSDAISTSELVIPGETREDRIGAVAKLKINIKNKVALNSAFEFSRGAEFGTFLNSRNILRFEPFKDYFINAKVNFQSATPSFNYHLNASPYKKFNYYFNDFSNQNILEIGGDLDLKWFDTKIFANYFRIDHFTYFSENSTPQQSGSSVNISQIGGDVTFDYGKFHLNARLLFQKTLSNSELFPAPDVIARANVFYQTKAFKNAAEIQTGIKAYYYTKFNSRDYMQLINEFTLPNSEAFSIGGRPILDAYFNMKVKRMFFFVEGQQFTTLLKHNTVYTAPHYPLYDFRLNIGIVWYLIN